MAFSVSIRNDVVSGAQNIAKSRTKTGDLLSVIDEEIAASTTNDEIVIAIDVSNLVVLGIYSNVDLTIKTNSSGSPDDTLSIVGGVPYVWDEDSYDACLIGTDVTKIFVTTGAGNAANLLITVLQNS